MIAPSHFFADGDALLGSVGRRSKVAAIESCPFSNVFKLYPQEVSRSSVATSYRSCARFGAWAGPSQLGF
jgi:hypothetical protein